MAKRNPPGSSRASDHDVCAEINHIGPYEIDGFMMPNGEFRQGLSSTARAVGSNHQRVSRVMNNLLAAGSRPCSAMSLMQLRAQKRRTSLNMGLSPSLS